MSDSAPASLSVVVSPTGRLHIVRAGQRATVCGMDTERHPFLGKHRRRRLRRLGWQIVGHSFAAYDDPDDRRPCFACRAGVLSGTGPGSELRSG